MVPACISTGASGNVGADRHMTDLSWGILQLHVQIDYIYAKDTKHSNNSLLFPTKKEIKKRIRVKGKM
jgi:hypothetical protein